MIDLLIQFGRLLGHCKGAWSCGCKIAVIVNSTVVTMDPVNEMVEDIVSDPGF